MRVNAERDGDVMHLAVGKEAPGFDLPGVQHLAAQGQDGLGFLVASGFGRAARRVAFDEKEFVAPDVLALAVGEFAGENGHRRLLALFDLLPGFGACLRGTDRQFGDFSGGIGVFIEPEFQRVAHHA